MKKTLLIAGALLALTASMASATGVNLFWTDCSPAAGGVGVSNQNNACTSNSGQFILVASLNPGPGIDAAVGAEGVIDIQIASVAMDPWWQMKAGGCRATALSSSFSFSFLSGACLDPWQNQAFGGLDYAYNPPDTDPSHNLPNRARLRVAGVVQASAAGPMAAGSEYYIFEAIISKQKSVGAGSCVGCADAACFVLNSIKVVQPADDVNGDKFYSTADQSQFATYQAGAAGCAATPNRNRTWGSVKSLYR